MLLHRLVRCLVGLSDTDPSQERFGTFDKRYCLFFRQQ
jgi:hypothetical protein